MKALSLTQPWASLVALGHKQIETRSWSTKYRGLLAIHAAKGFPATARQVAYHEEPFRTVLSEAHLIPTQRTGMVPENLPRGAIIAVAELVDVRPTEELAEQITAHERAFGDYSPGRYAWLLCNIRALPEPISARGQLGLFDVPGGL